MANETVVIDIAARFVDRTGGKPAAVRQKIQRLGAACKTAAADLDRLGASLYKTRRQAEKLSQDSKMGRFGVSPQTGSGGAAGFPHKNQSFLKRLEDALRRTAEQLSEKFADTARGIKEKILKIADTAASQKSGPGGQNPAGWDGVTGPPFQAWWDNGVRDEAAYGGSGFVRAFLEGFGVAQAGKILRDGIKKVLDAAAGWEKPSGREEISGRGEPSGSEGGKGTEPQAPTERMVPMERTAPAVAAGAGDGWKLWDELKSWTVDTSGAFIGAILEEFDEAKVGKDVWNQLKTQGKAAMKAEKAGTKTAAAAGAAAGTSTTAITAAGWIVGALGLVDAGMEIAEGFEAKSRKQSRDAYVTGAAKTGMVVSGAGIGALIGSIIPGLGTAVGAAVGAGIGGAAALAGGDSAGQWISDSLDGTQRIREATDNLAEAREAFSQSVKKDQSTQRLISEYERLYGLLNDAKTPVSERKQLELEIKGVVQELSELYPDFIGKQDVLNGRVSANLDILKEISPLERERARWDLKKKVKDARETFEEKDVAGKLKESDQELAENMETANKIKKAMEDAEPLMAEFDDLMKKVEDDREYSFSEEYYNELGVLQEKINAVTGEAGFQYHGRLDAFRFDFLEEADKKYGEYVDAVLSELARNSGLRETYEELFLSEKALIENEAGLNGSIEDAIANFDRLDASQKDALKDAIGQVLALQRELKNLPEELKIPVYLVEKYQNLVYGEGVSWKTGLEFANASAQNPVTGKTVSKYALGGIVDKPHLGLVGEAGPEAVIPLSGSRRERGVSLWERAGRALGVWPPAGGQAAGSQSYLPQAARCLPDSAAGISIHLGGMNFSFEGVGVSDPDSVVSAIREQMPQAVNELCRMIANMLPRSFGNMA